MRVIEVAHVEGLPLPVITMDGEPLHRSVNVAMHIHRPTIILLGGHRVTEPTRVVKNGIVLGQDNAGLDGAP